VWKFQELAQKRYAEQNITSVMPAEEMVVREVHKILENISKFEYGNEAVVKLVKSNKQLFKVGLILIK